MNRHLKNEYDELAIGIYYNGICAGWVPQDLNEVISRLMDAGKAFFCRIVSTARKNKWVKIDTKVYMAE